MEAPIVGAAPSKDGLVEPGLAFTDLSGEVEGRVPAPLFESASVARYA